MTPYFYPAKLLSYDKHKRTAKISIAGLTDGASDGLTALLAYPIGDDDFDTERELLAGADCWVFFENGDMACPVVAFYRSHSEGAVVDIRRIRQANIELLARQSMLLNADGGITANTPTFTINAHLVVNGDITHKGSLEQSGDQNVSGKITASDDVVGGGKSLKSHRHGGVKTGGGSTSGPI